MKIIYFHQHFSTPAGATGTRSYEMASRLVRAGHDVTVVCGSYSAGCTGLTDVFDNGRRQGCVDGINIIELQLDYSNSQSFLKRSLIFLLYAFRSICLALRADYDLIISTSTPLTAGLPGVFARWLRRKPFVFEVRDLWPELPKEMGVITNPLVLAAMSILEWSSYHSARRCIGLAPGIVDGIAKRGVERDNILMVPNGCDLDLFGNGKSCERPPGVEVDDLMVLFSGTHGQANGLDAVMEAAAELKCRGRTDIKFVLIGEGKLKPAYQQRVAKEELGNILFMAPVAKTELAHVMQSADIGLQILANVPAFYYGTSPNKFFDYIASGLPVLTNYPGWIADLIQKNECGYCIEPDDASLFADTLEHAADHKEQLKPMGSKGRLLAEKEFDREQLASRWMKWLEGTVR